MRLIGSAILVALASCGATSSPGSSPERVTPAQPPERPLRAACAATFAEMQGRDPCEHAGPTTRCDYPEGVCGCAPMATCDGSAPPQISTWHCGPPGAYIVHGCNL